MIYHTLDGKLGMSMCLRLMITNIIHVSHTAAISAGASTRTESYFAYEAVPFLGTNLLSLLPLLPSFPPPCYGCMAAPQLSPRADAYAHSDFLLYNPQGNLITVFLDGSFSTMHFRILPGTPTFQSWGSIFHFDLCVDAYLGSNLEIGGCGGWTL